MTTKWMQIACWVPKLQTRTQIMYYWLFFHCNHRCVKARHSYFMRTLPVLLILYTYIYCLHLGYLLIISGPGSSVGIVTAYGLDGPGIESRWGDIFRTCPDRAWDPPSLLYNGYRVFPGGKLRPGRDAGPSHPSRAEVKNRVELYLYSP
jgi:hypothetical protein